MATIEQRRGNDGQRVYRVKVRRKGQLPRTATFTKLAEARTWAQMTEGAVLEGRHFKTPEAKKHTLADLIDRYAQAILPQKRPSTVYGQAYQLRWWEAQLGHCLLADITPALLGAYRDKLTREKPTLQAHATLNRYLAVLSHAFTIAVQEWQWCDDGVRFTPYQVANFGEGIDLRSQIPKEEETFVPYAILLHCTQHSRYCSHSLLSFGGRQDVMLYD